MSMDIARLNRTIATLAYRLEEIDSLQSRLSELLVTIQQLQKAEEANRQLLETIMKQLQ